MHYRETQELLSAPQREVVLIDIAQRWVRHPSDLVGAIVALIAMLFAVLYSAYAPAITISLPATSADSHSAIATLLYIPINFFAGLVSFILPLIIFGYIIFRRRWRLLVTALGACLLAVGASYLISFIAEYWWPYSQFTDEFISTLEVQSFISLVPYVALVSALFTVTNTIEDSRLAKICWWILAIVLVLSVLKGEQLITGAIITTLLGVCMGMLARWIMGRAPKRAMGEDLVKLVRKADIDVVQLIRLDDIANTEQIQRHLITSDAPFGFTDSLTLDSLQKMVKRRADSEESGNFRETVAAAPSEIAALSETTTPVSATTPAQISAPAENAAPTAEMLRINARQRFPITSSAIISRNYLAEDSQGKKYHLLVLDEDRRILNILESLWQRIALKIPFRRNPQNLENAAEHMCLMMLQTERLGIIPPQFKALGSSLLSIAIAVEIEDETRLSLLDASTISDTQLDELWQDLLTAHRQGLSHGNIHTATISLSANGRLQLRDWYSGRIAAPEYSRLLDMAQLASMWAALIGTERTLASIKRSLSEAQILSLAPFLQYSALPEQTRTQFSKKDLENLRSALTEQIPSASPMPTITLRRFSIKTVVMVVIGVVAIYVLLGSINFPEVSAAVRSANPIWMIFAFISGLLTYIGSGVILNAYTQEKLQLRDSILVQVGASVVTLVAPAGVGPAALNLRFLQKKGIQTAPALATVTMVQISQFLTTVLLLLILSLSLGELGTLSLPSASIVTGIGIFLLLLGLLLIIPQLRNWLLAKIRPVFSQIWPRLVWLGTHPQRLLIGFCGAIILTAGFVACFGFSLYSFGYELPLATLTVTYLVANSVGSAVPSPGGIGPVEAALTGGLVLAGIPSSIAFSTAVLYRLLTFWGRVPLGWLGLYLCNRKDLI
ncbi:lysylphosphatidylglycerol synthase domain-containing protein [uncultured Arcanobacterium sp.]|uniref:lysylphosphatidylglycerol synthase domain-containing protein n=1 Tax=uncultured Arcanobacterium sp. TaxID=487520 RepID=UPI00262E1A34|nr:lysylphosphatidylglycerol synthase domain-containing protein [uncultured Arcanobacterium sp.]